MNGELNPPSQKQPPSKSVQQHSSVHPFGEVSCPRQVLVVDTHGGAADILADLIGRLYRGVISVTEVPSLDVKLTGCYDLLMTSSPHLAIQLKANFPDVPLVLITKHTVVLHLLTALHNCVEEIVVLPERARDLHLMISYFVETYLPTTGD